jgi:uncharacterized protein (DUF1684 family)
MTDTRSPGDELARFHEARRARAVSPRGPLALVNTQWVDSAQPVWGVAGTWAPAPDGLPGLTVTATAADGVSVDGDLVDGTVLVAGEGSVTPSTVRFSETVAGTVIGDDAGRSWGLRVWDADSEGIRRFGSIDAFPHDPSWVVTADFVPTEEGAQVDIRHQADLDLSRPKPLPGLIRFTLDGVDHELAAFPSGTGDRLQLVFGDATNGDSTYSVGRFLFPTPGDDGTIVLDFNQAVLPPCAFSYAFNCPIPPPQNRLAVRIEAGEKNVLDATGALLH